MIKFNFFKIIILIIVVIIFYIVISSIFLPSGLWYDLYNFEPNTLEVISLGSSHAYFSIIPTVVNNVLNIDSFNFSDQGSKVYHLEFALEEILKYQKPQIVILELYSLRQTPEIHEDGNLYTHRITDTMKNLKTKYRAIKYNVDKDDYLEFFFPISTFHLSWKNENINEDFETHFKSKFNDRVYGFEFDNNIYSETDNDPLSLNNDDSSILRLEEKTFNSLKAITRLCVQNNIKLIYIVAPFIEQDGFTVDELEDYIRGIEDYAKQNNIEIINYNDASSTGVVFYKGDMRDSAHLNVHGAYKLTQHLSSYINDNYSHLLSEEEWNYKNDSELRYEDFQNRYIESLKVKNSINSRYILQRNNYFSNMVEYLNLLKDKPYITIISAKNLNPNYIDSDIIRAFRNLGIELEIENNKPSNYIAIIDDSNDSISFESNNVINIKSDNEQIESLNLPFKLEVFSSNINCGSNSSIKINFNEYSLNEDGFNIVVYDTVLREVVSRANFNLNTNLQHYYDRELVFEKFDESKIIYDVDIESHFSGCIEDCDNEVTEEGVIIYVGTDDPRFYLNDFDTQSNHLILKADIECPQATWFEVRFNSIIEREQLVTGENVIYIEMKSNEPINDIRIDPVNIRGDYLIKGIEICDLSKYGGSSN